MLFHPISFNSNLEQKRKPENFTPFESKGEDMQHSQIIWKRVWAKKKRPLTGQLSCLIMRSMQFLHFQRAFLRKLAINYFVSCATPTQSSESGRKEKSLENWNENVWNLSKHKINRKKCFEKKFSRFGSDHKLCNGSSGCKVTWPQWRLIFHGCNNPTVPPSRKWVFVVFYIILLQIYTYEKMIDDCFDALKAISTMVWDAEALANAVWNKTVNYFTLFL